MALPASSLLRLGRFPLARCLFVLEQVRARALARAVPAVAAAAEHAVARVKDALDLDQRQRALRTTRFPPEARELDQLVDAAVIGLDTYCESQIDLFRGQERAAAAARLRRILLPDGIIGITRLPYVDEHMQIEALLARAAAADVLADVALLPDMAAILARVREVNAAYGQMLRDAHETLTRADVRARHDECQELLCQVTGLILGQFIETPARHADRDYMLEPILRGDEALRERRRRRRAHGDAGDESPGDRLPEPDDDSGPTSS